MLKMIEDIQIILKSYGYMGDTNNIDKNNIINFSNYVNKIIEFKQGQIYKVDSDVDRSALGFDFERPIYLYEGLVDKSNPTKPFADILGFELAQQFSKLNDIPLIEVLPYGAKGLVILTGDDDQAYLEKYSEQIKVIKDFPITYFLHPLTRHNKETLSNLNSNIEFGIHPDALEAPKKYSELAMEQLKNIQAIVENKIISVRNHGYLSDGYQGHLETWEKLGLEIDVNIPGVDGTALNGSYLPMKVKKIEGTWSEHYSLLTAFGDGMIFAYNMTESEAVSKIKKLAKQIENSIPGVLVFNLHPQNISLTTKIHKSILSIAKRKKWEAMKLGDYFNWIKILESLTIEKSDGEYIIRSSKNVNISGVVLNFNNIRKLSILERLFGKGYIMLPDFKNEIRIKYE